MPSQVIGEEGKEIIKKLKKTLKKAKLCQSLSLVIGNLMLE